MFQYIGAAVSLVALIAALYGGYKWGAHDLEITKAQLQELRDKEGLIKKSNDDFQKQLKTELEAQAKDHEAKMTDLKQRDDKEMAALQAAKSQAEKNATAFRNQAGSAAGRIATLQGQLKNSVSVDEKARLQKDLAAAIADRDTALARAGGEDCLRLPVPAESVKSLNLAARR